jgi:Rad3-related DNA helicase
LCRAVIFVGVPYPPVKDMKIMEKKNYQDTINKHADDTESISKPINGK